MSEGGDGGRVKLSKEEEGRYSKLYGKQWRQLRRWVDRGVEVGEACPLHDPAAMPGWWTRHMKWRVPAEIEAAALAAARGVVDPVTPEPAMAAASVVAPAAATPKVAAPAPVGVKIDLESFDPEEGDRLRELKQIQAAKFKQLKDALLAGDDCSVLESKYLKLSETIDKIESRVTERLKKRGLYILRAEVEADLAANAELLRQMDESQERRVLEQCPSLTTDQRIEVAEAIRLSVQAKFRILSKLKSLNGDDLLRELAATE